MAHEPNDSDLAIRRAANRFVLEVGAVLLERRRRAPKSFDRWVDESCPFDRVTAERLMQAVVDQAAFGDEAPEPWTALR